MEWGNKNGKKLLHGVASALDDFFPRVVHAQKEKVQKFSTKMKISL